MTKVKIFLQLLLFMIKSIASQAKVVSDNFWDTRIVWYRIIREVANKHLVIIIDLLRFVTADLLLKVDLS